MSGSPPVLACRENPPKKGQRKGCRDAVGARFRHGPGDAVNFCYSNTHARTERLGDQPFLTIRSDCSIQEADAVQQRDAALCSFLGVSLLGLGALRRGLLEGPPVDPLVLRPIGQRLAPL